MSKIAVESMPIIGLRFAVYGNLKFTRKKLAILPHQSLGKMTRNCRYLQNLLISPISVSIKSFSAALTKFTDSCGVHAYKPEHYFTSFKYLFGSFKFPPRNWPFCLTHPLAKSPTCHSCFFPKASHFSNNKCLYQTVFCLKHG